MNRFLLALALAACGGAPSPATIGNQPAASPEPVARHYLGITVGATQRELGTHVKLPPELELKSEMSLAEPDSHLVGASSGTAYVLLLVNWDGVVTDEVQVASAATWRLTPDCDEEMTVALAVPPCDMRYAWHVRAGKLEALATAHCLCNAIDE